MTWPAANSRPWMTEENRALAHQLWLWGEPASRIAKRMGHGCTKNAIIGYARRNDWPPRTSPIPRFGIRATGPVPRVPSKPHRSAAVIAARKPPTPPAVPVAPPAPVLVVVPPPSPPPEPREPMLATCCWVVSSGRPWRYCDAPVCEVGSSWCEDHRARVYFRSARQERAAA
ncbi:MAG TPA: hypothetical protein VJO13_19295 [Ktedonobacterales bacterium]|nr:hypothetical protein [Ktedonobacterales bacterium]